MSEVDRKRIAGAGARGAGLSVRGRRVAARRQQPFWPEADRLHALLMNRAEVLSGCIEDSPEEDDDG